MLILLTTLNQLLSNINTKNFLQTAQFFINLTDPNLELLCSNATGRPTRSPTDGKCIVPQRFGRRRRRLVLFSH